MSATNRGGWCWLILKDNVMKQTITTHLVILISIASLAALAADRATGRGVPVKGRANPNEIKTYSSFDPPGLPDSAEVFPAGLLKFDSAELAQVLNVYQEMSGRTMIRGSALPDVKVSIQSQTALTRREALQMLDTVLAANGVTMVLLGTKAVKAVPSAQALSEAAPVIQLPAEQLPESSSYMTYIVELKRSRPRELAPALAPFAKGSNSILAIDANGILILRDYSSNIRRMLQVIDLLEKDQVPEPPQK
jgi:hypothetical protein